MLVKSQINKQMRTGYHGIFYLEIYMYICSKKNILKFIHKDIPHIYRYLSFLDQKLPTLVLIQKLRSIQKVAILKMSYHLRIYLHVYLNLFDMQRLSYQGPVLFIFLHKRVSLSFKIQNILSTSTRMYMHLFVAYTFFPCII